MQLHFLKHFSWRSFGNTHTKQLRIEIDLIAVGRTTQLVRVYHVGVWMSNDHVFVSDLVFGLSPNILLSADVSVRGSVILLQFVFGVSLRLIRHVGRELGKRILLLKVSESFVIYGVHFRVVLVVHVVFVFGKGALLTCLKRMTLQLGVVVGLRSLVGVGLDLGKGELKRC